MGNLNYSLQNILDGQGIEISIAGMLVVFVALALICSFIALLPAILDVVAKVYPPEDDPAASRDSAKTEGEILAAIGFALHATNMSKLLMDK